MFFHILYTSEIFEGCEKLAKPTYCLWKSDYETENALLQEKKKYIDSGFRVVVYQDGQNERMIHDGLKELIKNHSPWESELWKDCGRA